MKAFFEKYLGVGGASSFAEKDEAMVYTYESTVDEIKVAEDSTLYGSDKNG